MNIWRYRKPQLNGIFQNEEYRHYVLRIEGIVRLSRVWLIPKDAKKPADGRFKVNRKKNGVETL